MNRRFGTGSSQPIRLLEAHHSPAEVYQFYRAAELCYVGSLRDGMNLVAKECVCARDDERGVLVLSRLAGAAKQLDAALHINPYAVDETASVLRRALAMPMAEQSARMRRLRANVATFNAAWWAQQLIGDCVRVARAIPRTCSPAVVRFPVRGDHQLEQESADSPVST